MRAPDRVQRRFEAAKPNQVWVADITYVPTQEGFLYLAALLEVLRQRGRAGTELAQFGTIRADLGYLPGASPVAAAARRPFRRLVGGVGPSPGSYTALVTQLPIMD